MGVAYYIVLERKIEGLDTMMDGKSLARAIEDLDGEAEQLGVRPLSEFISADPEELAELLGDGEAELGREELPPVQHFPAPDGLATVRALRRFLENAPRTLEHAAGVLQDLADCERILSSAEEREVGFHLAVDI